LWIILIDLRAAKQYNYSRDRQSAISKGEIDMTGFILITNKTIDKKSSHNPYTQDYARFFV